MVTDSQDDADEIRRKMAQIRRELHQDVRGVVASAEAVTDWHRYIRNYPWIAVAAAAAAGYFVVPRRHKPETVAVAVTVPERAAPEKPKAREAKAARAGLVAGAWALLGPVAMRAAQSYATQYLENWIAEQQQRMAEGPPPPGQTRTPGRPSGAAGF